MKQSNHKIIIYQIFTRLFGNTNTTNKFYGSIEENGVGKFNDINHSALQSIKQMGFTHVWYTGIIEHALMTDYSAYNIAVDDPDVIKGRAGSPYAIKDYYDVNPDLANDIPNRMHEFEELIERTHASGLKLFIDFVPNHVARSYKSDAKPDGVSDLGENDYTNLSFSPNNNFYYIPNNAFICPQGYNAGGDGFTSPLKNGSYNENQAKATGNDVFNEAPSINDWFETVKLNYGIDYLNNRQEYFSPIPDTWTKMLDILLFWAEKGVDGFRCDMCEMVPIQFWNYAISQVKLQYPDICFMGEAYDANNYKHFIYDGKFDILYDKVGLYDAVKSVIRNQATCHAIMLALYNTNTQGIQHNMLHFLENHDEQRIACPDFAGNAQLGIPMMVLSATLTTGPVMVYFGQEIGVTASGTTGFSGDDGRTSIFDYCAVPEFQAWVNNKKFDGGKLTKEQTQLRQFYAKLLNICRTEKAFIYGDIQELQSAYQNTWGYNKDRCFSFARYTKQNCVIIVTSFDFENDTTYNFYLPKYLADRAEYTGDDYQLIDLLDPEFKYSVTKSQLLGGFEINVKRCTSRCIKIIQPA